ncbi:N-alpha-acetyltransferase 38-B, NatC auxiliary subunit-like [Eriocheir sinensis]|uniref:N-alpha-acetyltransferase 38-B, NatC auxiliary subunit-like n=1 Tax=Eriocheir sinensis TaxID=95602 RepID=UPI0021C91BB8|nr:N-alpha-acetyltransferase 38-B, NatC auxiliary subunit-like [Eriocheir sinensis]
MKTGGDFRDHLVDLTDGCNRPGDAPTDKQPQRRSTPGRMKLEKWLHSSMKIEMTDGRTLVGSFVCTDRDNNIILGSCTEHLRPDEDGREEEPRVLGLAMIPGRHIISICIDEASQPPAAPPSLYS